MKAGPAKLPSAQDGGPVRRYEKERPGELLHMDMKKLGRFDQPGHRVTGGIPGAPGSKRQHARHENQCNGQT